MGRFILLGSSALFVGLANPNELKFAWTILATALLALDFMAEKRKKGSAALLTGMTLQAIAWFWLLNGHWYMGVLLLILEVLRQIASRKKILKIDLGGIWTSFPWPQLHPWQDIELAILKAGMLTIEYRNGRVLQQPIEKDPLLQESEFNEFCKQQCNP